MTKTVATATVAVAAGKLVGNLECAMMNVGYNDTVISHSGAANNDDRGDTCDGGGD